MKHIAIAAMILSLFVCSACATNDQCTDCSTPTSGNNHPIIVPTIIVPGPVQSNPPPEEEHPIEEPPIHIAEP